MAAYLQVTFWLALLSFSCIAHAAARYTLVCNGNSITLGTGSDTPWPSLLSNSYSPTWNITNAGVNGITTQQKTTDGFVFPVQGWKSATATRNFVINWEVGNDILLNSVSGAAAYVNYTNWNYRITTNGQEVFSCTVFKRADLSGANETARTDFNTLLRANWRNTSVGLIDLATNVLLDVTLHPENFHVDQIHPNAAGNVIIAAQVSLFLSEFLRTRIGFEATVTVPTSAYYSSAVNVRPGDGEICSNNPPIFSWFYNTDHRVGGEGGTTEQTNSFQFQVASNSAFTGTLLVDTNTPLNFFNFIGPFSTAHGTQFWWRVKYITNGISFWTNAYTFSLTANASNWDRSMFTNDNYLSTNAVHPIFAFRGGEQAAIYTWMQTQDDWPTIVSSATALTNEAHFTSHQPWFTNSTPNPTFSTVQPPDAFTRVTRLGALLNLWTFSGDNRWTNASMTGWLVTNLYKFTQWHNHIGNNWAVVDYAQPAGSPEVPRLLAATYDWMYDYLGANTATFNGQLRTNALLGLNRTMLWYHYTAFQKDSPSGSAAVSNAWQIAWQYPTNRNSMTWPQLPKLGISHTIMTVHNVMPLAAVIQNDSAEGRFAFVWMLNYMLARTSPYAGFAAHHVGPYGYVDNHTYNQNFFSAMMHLRVTHPQAQLERTEFAKRFPDWWTRMNPYRMVHYHGPYADGAVYSAGLHSGNLGDEARGWDLAAATGSGLAMQAYNLNAEFSISVTPQAQWHQLPLRYHFRTTPAPQTNTTSAVYPEDGYVIASTKSPSEFDAYTNGVGFSMQARPRGNTSGHDTYSDLSFDMWAYGTQLTDGGGIGLDPYSYVSDASPTLFVNGYGYSGDSFATTRYGHSPRLPVSSSIVAFTNFNADFVYACADGTGLFTNSWHPLNWLVTKVKRHVLFPRSKYWVIYDEFSSTSNATFAFRWHIPWAFRYDAAGLPLTNEREFLGERMGSNSLAMTTNGFTYEAGNYAFASYPNPPRVPVHVMFGNATNQFGVFNAVGTASLGVSTPNAVGTAATNSTLNPFRNWTWATLNPDRAVGMWVTNTVAATNWHFLTVIVPQQRGVAAPTFRRLDDNTVAVTYDGVTETNTFGTNYPVYTYMVELESAPNLSVDFPAETEPPRKARAVRVRGTLIR